MNHLYRVVFNAATGVWQAVSEIARGPAKSSSPARRARRAAYAVSAVLALPAGAYAQQQWDGGSTVANGVVDGGAGVWDVQASNWTTVDGSANQIWNSGTAVFSGPAGVVAVNGNIGVSGLDIKTDGYRLVGGSGSRLTLVNSLDGYTAIHTGSGVSAALDVELSGAGQLNKQGSGTLVLGGVNSYTGGTALSAGTLIVDNDAAIGSGDLTLQGNTLLDSTRSVTLYNGVHLQGQSIVASTGDLTLAGTVNGAGSLIKNGSGRLTLYGANSYAGGTTLNGGTLRVGQGSALGFAALTVGGAATIEAMPGGVTLSNAVALNGALTVAGADSLRLNGWVSGAGNLIKTGSGTLTLNGANGSFSGGTTLQQGALVLGSGGALGTGQLLVDGKGSLLLPNGATLSNALRIDGELTLQTDQTTLLIGPVTGNGKLVKTGVDELITMGSKTFTGELEIAGGIVTTLEPDALGNPSNVTVGAGTTLNINGNSYFGGLTGAGTTNINAGSTLSVGNNETYGEYSGSVTGQGMLNKVGTGTLRLTGTRTSDGTTIVSGGTLLVDGSITSTGGVSVETGATLGGTGNISGLTTVSNNAHLAGASGQTLTFNQLTFSQDSNIDVKLGSPFTGNVPLFKVDGNLILDGKLNVVDGGAMGNGVYRLFDYASSLVNNIAEFGTLPLNTSPTDLTIQTAFPGQVNLVVSSPNLTLQFWDGWDQIANGAVEGGTGVWTHASANWTDFSGNTNTGWQQQFAVFMGSAGTVMVDGTQTVEGMQFMTDGYLLIPYGGASLNAVNGSTGTFAVRVDPNVTATLDLPIDGTATLQKLDFGTLVLKGANAYTGGTKLTGGTLVLGNDTALGMGELRVAAGTVLDSNQAVAPANDIILDGQLTLPGSNDMSLTGNISGSGGLLKGGASTLTLAGVNSFTGPVALNAGTLQLASASALGSSAVSAANGTRLTVTHAMTLGNQISIDGFFDVAGAGPLTLNGGIQGAGMLIKRDAADVTLNGVNTYAGGTLLNAGKLVLGNDAALGSGTLTVAQAPGILSTASAVTLANRVALNAPLTVDSPNDLTLNGQVSGTAGLVKQGAGTLTLNSFNTTYTGPVTLAGGSLALSNPYAMGTGSLTALGASQLIASRLLTLGNTVDVIGELSVAGADALTLTGEVKGAGTLNKTGAGTLTLSGDNTFGGQINVQQGTFVGFGDASLGQGAASLSLSAGANAVLSGSAALTGLHGAGSLTLGADNTLNVGGSGLNNVFAGQLSGAGALAKSGAGNLTLSGANTLSGAATVDAGSLTVDGALASTTVQVKNGATLAGNGSLAGQVTVANGGHLALASGQTLTMGGLTLQNGSNLDVALGAAVQNANAVLKVNGDLTLAGTLNVSDIGGFGSGLYRLINYTGMLTNNGLLIGTTPVGTDALTLQFAQGNQVNAVVAAPGTRVQFWDGAQAAPNGIVDGGSGTWASATNWTDGSGAANGAWTQGFAVFQGTPGTVTVQGTQNLTGMQFVSDGYQLTGSTGALNLVNGASGEASFRVDPNVTATLDVALTGSGTLGKIDSGTLVLNGANSYTGGTALNGGTLVAGNDLALGTGALIAADGVTLDSNTAVSLNNGVVLNGALQVAGTNALTLNGAISGAGSLVKSGPATLSLNHANDYSGGTLLQAGGLNVGNGTALGSGTLQVAGTGTLEASQPMALGNQILLDAGLTVQGSNALTLNGNIAGVGSLNKSGAGTLTLNGANSHTGGTQVSAGTLALGANGSFSGAGGVNIASGATLDLSAAKGTQVLGRLAGSGALKLGAGATQVGDATDSNFAGSISGAGMFVKQGAGTTTLSGSNSYTGGTLVAAGTLQMGAASAVVQNTAYEVLSGATLDLNGYALQASSLTGLGNVALGNSNLTINTAAGTISSYAGSVAGSGDLIKTGTGTLALNAASTLTGDVQLKEGRIDLGHALGLGTGTLVMDDGTLLGLTTNGMTVANNLHMSGTNDPVLDTGANNTTWAGAITGAGLLTKAGTGTLTLTSTANTYTGNTDVAQGTLKAGGAGVLSSASAYNVATGATLDTAGYSQTVGALTNSGTVNLSGSTPGAVLKVTGPYVGSSGTLAVSTVLAADGSVTDKLLLSGPAAVASGTTQVAITNAGGLGAQTGASGIEVVGTENGASLQSGSFTLAGGHVDAGAYEYRLIQTAQGAALHSAAPAQEPQTPQQPQQPQQPAYRDEVPLLSALPEQLRVADMAMLGDMRRRAGDGSVDDGHRAWGRVLRIAPTISQQGTVNPESTGHLTGFQAGVDVYAQRNFNAGLYVGQLEGEMDVRGFASGMDRKYAGYNKLRNRYLGIYGTWQHDSGFYADAVLQGADYRNNLRTGDTGAGARTKGHGWLASLEVGKSFDLGNDWKLEPQAQLTYHKLNLDDTDLSLATVNNDADDQWTLRLGARVQGSFNVGGSVVQPFGRVNLYTSSGTTDVAQFATSSASTDIRAKGGSTSTELATGAQVQLTKRTSLYGEVGKLWANGGDSRIKSGVQGSVGVQVRW